MLQTDEERVHLRSIEESLRLVLLLGVPSLVGVLFLAPNLLYLFRPEYAVAGDVLRLT
jgi:O-antigen/teichoic acid export membrane protein